MSMDIFEFWAEVAPSDKIHPRDRYALDRFDHAFDLRCLPACFGGPLRTAPVVLLYLSLGFSQQEDVDEADTPKGQARYAERRTGYQLLEGPDDHKSGWKWWTERTRLFGHWQTLRDKVAILDICGYHSKNFNDRHALAALPSSRETIDWAQQVLFPHAERGERVVICMRSPRYWGLGKRRRYGKTLFVPEVTQGGHMFRAGEHAATRDEVLAAVKAAIGL